MDRIIYSYEVCNGINSLIGGKESKAICTRTPKQPIISKSSSGGTSLPTRMSFPNSPVRESLPANPLRMSLKLLTCNGVVKAVARAVNTYTTKEQIQVLQIGTQCKAATISTRAYNSIDTAIDLLYDSGIDPITHKVIVIAPAADELVIARSNRAECVIAISPKEDIIAHKRRTEAVIAISPIDEIILRFSNEEVIAPSPKEEVIAGRAKEAVIAC